MALFKSKTQRNFEKVILLLGDCILDGKIKCNASDAMKEICIAPAVCTILYTFGKFKDYDEIKRIYRKGVFENCDKRDAEQICDLFDEVSDLCLEGINILLLTKKSLNIKPDDNVPVFFLTALIAMSRLDPKSYVQIAGDDIMRFAVKMSNKEYDCDSDFFRDVEMIFKITVMALESI